MTIIFPQAQQAKNLDWDFACSELQTLLPEHLFQMVRRAAEMSVFVKEIFENYPHAAGGALLWHEATRDPSIKAGLTAQIMQHMVSHEYNEEQLMCQLRVIRKLHSGAIATLELTDNLPIESSSLRVSLLADCLIEAAYHWCYQFNQARFGQPSSSNNEASQMLIVAMGKLGGFELNFSSDIDLIFFYPEDGETQGEGRSIDNARFFRRLSTQLIRILDEITQDGFVFRVDMRLRPYGDSGALVMSLVQAEEYYQEQGREWERFAMIRARVITGMQQDKHQLEAIFKPFSFRRYIDYGIIDSIRNMKEMIQREVRRKKLTDNIKLGAGGIREIEFIVQSLQLIQGGRDKRLCQRNTFKVLPLLVEAKMLPQQTAEHLMEAYQFLRRLEHIIQELAEKQTQQLPELECEREIVASAMKCDSWTQLRQQLQNHQKRVNQHFNELLGEERQQALNRDDFYQSLAEGHIELAQLQKKVAEQFKRELSAEEGEAFLQKIESFLNDSGVQGLSAKGAARLKIFFPALLSTCLAHPMSQQVLTRLLKVLHAILKRTAYLELLSENPPILQHLVDLAGQSDWMVKRLSEFPILIDELLYPNSLYEPLQTSDLKAELQQALLRIDVDDEEQLLDTVRAYKQINELRVAAALLAERLSISQVSRYLTQLAEVVLQTSVEQCWRLLVRQYGVPEGLAEVPHQSGFAVIGYGKLGGVELGFGSDLDLVFLFNQPSEQLTTGNRQITNGRFYTRLAQKLIHFLSTRPNQGLLYEVDMRLRPSGSSGLLVSHIDAYRDYQLEAAWTWEHQALVRARFVAGDPCLIEAFALVRKAALAQTKKQNRLKSDVISMREKMREQLEKHAPDRVDLKQTAGGLVDIEFLAQYFALSLSDSVEVPFNMVDCLQLAQAESLIDSDECKQLIRYYRLFRNRLNENALMDKSSLCLKSEFADSLNIVQSIWQKYLPD